MSKKRTISISLTPAEARAGKAMREQRVYAARAMMFEAMRQEALEG